MKKIFFVFLLFCGIILSAQNQSIEKTYLFTIYDGANLSSMHQYSQNYLSTYRIASRELDHLIEEKKISLSIKMIYTFIVGMPLTHEEGHRSVLTNLGIGSVSQPFFKKGAAYVKGVTDETLKNLRNTDFPNYIRLHTGGLESDYALNKNTADLLIFEEDNKETLAAEYFVRKLSPIQYHLTTFIPKMMPDLKEESDELERDIVGHDVWGMVRHLHRPEMEFYRYTQFDDLTVEEKKYAKKIAYKSFFNLVDPLLLGKTNFKFNDDFKFNFSFGQSLSPFGDYLDFNLWLWNKDKYKVNGYFREYFNKENSFYAGGFSLRQFEITKKLKTSVSVNVWTQPKELSFYTADSFFGGSFDTQIYYKIYKNTDKKNKSLGLFTDIYYKTDGFMTEYSSLEKDFGMRFGVGFSY